MSTSRTRITAIAVAVLSAACGGGGDGGGSAPAPQPPTYVVISSANQDTVARASLASIMPFLNVPSTGTATSDATLRSGVTRLALRSLDAASKPTPTAAGMARVLAQYRATYPCEVAGTWTASWDDKDNNGALSAGDSMSMTFAKCDDGLGGVVDGGMAIAFATYSETPTTEDMTGTMAFQAMTTVDSTGSFSMNGEVGFHMNQTITSTGLDVLGSFTVGSGGLTASKQGVAGGLSDTFVYRAGYSVSDRDFSSRVPGVSSWEVISVSGSFGTQSLGGDLSLATTVPFKSVFTNPAGDIFPTEGQMTATGHLNTKLGVSATASTQARMDLCDDGDNTWEASKMVTWDWLLQ